MIEYFPELIPLIKIALALLLGSLVGIEREFTDKPMGLRGLMLITLGTTLFHFLGNVKFEIWGR